MWLLCVFLWLSTLQLCRTIFTSVQLPDEFQFQNPCCCSCMNRREFWLLLKQSLQPFSRVWWQERETGQSVQQWTKCDMRLNKLDINWFFSFLPPHCLLEVQYPGEDVQTAVRNFILKVENTVMKKQESIIPLNPGFKLYDFMNYFLT